MKSKDIGNIISEFQMSNKRSLLIDGPWGSGKTHQIRRYIDINKNSKIIGIHYISLFGKETIDEINTELHRIINPGIFTARRIATSGLNIISKAISPIPIVGNISGLVDALGFSINNLDDKNITGNRIIVFDDLERIDNKLSFISLLGYFNSLYLSQVRIICSVSSENINEDKKEEFHDFKEKIFDRVLVIDESDGEIISSYFDNYKVDGLENIFSEFENNLRLAQKTAQFYREINDYVEKNNYDLKGKISNLQLIRSCNQTIKICFKQHGKPIIDTKDKDAAHYQEIAYNHDLKAVGENIANGIHRYLRVENKQSNDPNLQTYSENIVKSLIDIFLYRNYNLFDSIFKPKENVISNKDFLDGDLFYLSDDNKNKYSTEFFVRLKKRELVFDDINIKRFCDILRYTDFSFSNDEMDVIVDLMFADEQNNNSEYSDVGFSVLETLRLVPGRRDISSFDIWAEKINSKRDKLEIENTITKLKTNFLEKTFSDMDKFIEKLSYRHNNNNNNEITKYIVDNNFLLPDLSSNISNEAWGYAHAMANYAKRVDKGTEFKNVALKICRNDLKNYSLIDRFDALIIYKIDSNYNLLKELGITKK